MPDRIEIRDGKEYRVTVLPEAVPQNNRPTTTHYRLSDVGKNPNKKPSKPLRAGVVPKEQDRDPSRFQNTKFPFAATINGKPVTVWPDWIEREEEAYE